METEKVFTCHLCKKTFSLKFGLKRHLKNVHSLNDANLNSLNLGGGFEKWRQICPIEECSEKFPRYCALREHLESVHNTKIEEEYLTFSSNENFEKWLHKMEEDTTAEYIKDSAPKMLADGSKKTTLWCNRSFGKRKFFEEEERKRTIKFRGSKKTGFLCPSKIDVETMNEGGEQIIEVAFFKTHCGHNSDLGHLRIDKHSRNIFAAKLQAGFSLDQVLEEVRENKLENISKRAKLIERKDLHNICRDYSIKCSTQNHQNDAMEQNPSTSGPDNQRLDSQSSVYNQQQQANSKSLVVGLKREFACNFCSKTFNAKWNLARHIKNKHNEGENQQERYLCERCSKWYTTKGNLDKHIKEDHLNSFLCSSCGFKTKNQNILDKHMLKYHTDTPNGDSIDKPFKCSMCSARFKWKSSVVTHEVKSHHKLNEGRLLIALRCALCSFEIVKKNAMHMHLEQVHGVILEKEELEFQTNEEFTAWKRKIELETNSLFYKKSCSKYSLSFKCHRSGTYTPAGQGKRKLKSSGSCKINSFCPAMIQVKILEHKFKVWFTKTHVGHKCELQHLSGELVRKLKVLRDRHKTSYLTDPELVLQLDGNRWQVSSSISSDVYTITKVETCCRCELQCRHCNTCVHEYICTCRDSSVRNNMCHHIHSVARSQSAAVSSDEAGEAVDWFPMTEVEVEVSSSNTCTTIEERKTQLASKFEQILQAVTSQEGIDIVDKAITPIMETLQALSTMSTSSDKITTTKQEEMKLELYPQRLFFSATKCIKS